MGIRNLIELSLADDGEAAVLCYRGRFGRRRRIFRNAQAAAIFKVERGIVDEPAAPIHATAPPGPTPSAATPI